jgi:peptidoglycan/xylan/chitin deacetylase (PgdA/CDA1 family)
MFKKIDSMNYTRPHGIMFHHFHKEGQQALGQGSITDETFNKIIIKLKNNYNLLSAIDWCNKAIEGILETDDICITFDDNLIGQYNVALPVLESHNLTGIWFVYSSPLIGVVEKLELYRYFRCSKFPDIDGFHSEFNNYVNIIFNNGEFASKISDFNPDIYLKAFPFYSKKDKFFRFLRDEILGEKRYNMIMDKMIEDSGVDLTAVSKEIWFDRDAVKYLSDNGHIIGLHSHTHPTRLNLLSFEEQLNEYKTNYNVLSDIIGSEICVAAHPTNSYNEDTFKVFEQLGITISFRSTMESGFNSNYEFPRIDHALLK